MTDDASRTPRWLDYIPLDDIVPAERNPKGHDEALIDDSMSMFGYTSPMEMDERTERLVAGHGRLENLQWRRRSGLSAPEGVIVDEDGTWRAPVVRGWRSRTDEEAEAYLIGANEISTRGGWDARLLPEMLEDLRDADAALLAVTGFAHNDLDRMLEDLERAAAPEHDDDDHDDDHDDDEDDEDDEETTTPGDTDLCATCPHRKD